MDGNRFGAVVHLKMLRHYCETITDKLDPALLLDIVYHDIHVATTFLSSPVFDMDTWLPEKCKPLVDAAEPYLPDVSEIKNRFLDPSMDHPRLRAIFVERRENLALWIASNVPKATAEHSSALVDLLKLRIALHQGRLVNLYIEAKTIYEARRVPERDDSILCQAYLSLATLAQIRSLNISVVVCGVRLFDSTRKLLANMQVMLELSEKSGSPEYEKYENARLWALYVGASVEMINGILPDERSWFTVHFARKAVDLGLGSEHGWNKVREVLRGFLFSDMVHPDGKEWYAKVLETRETAKA